MPASCVVPPECGCAACSPPAWCCSREACTPWLSPETACLARSLLSVEWRSSPRGLYWRLPSRARAIKGLEIGDGFAQAVFQVYFRLPSEGAPRFGDIRLPLARIVRWQRLMRDLQLAPRQITDALCKLDHGQFHRVTQVYRKTLLGRRQTGQAVHHV